MKELNKWNNEYKWDESGFLTGKIIFTINKEKLDKHPIKSYMQIGINWNLVKHRGQIYTRRLCQEFGHRQRECSQHKEKKQNGDYYATPAKEVMETEFPRVSETKT